MSRPPLEVADLVRAAGDAFIERSRTWITWKHVKVLLAIARCRTAALGGHPWSLPLLQSLFPGRLAFRPTQGHPPLSSVPRSNIPTHMDTPPPSHSIPIGPASTAG